MTHPATAGASAADKTLEAQLIERALAGDGAAFSQLVKPHIAMLYRVAARCCGGRTDLAEDAVQETLALVYERLSSYTPGTSLKAFLGSVAARRAHTLIRGEQRRRAREERGQRPEQSPTPEQLAAAEEMRETIHRALSTMPKKRREAALLRLDAGLSYSEIASAMGSTEGSARVLVHMALKELKSALTTAGSGR